MPSSNPIIVGGGASAGSPFALNHLTYISNVNPPQITSFNAERLTDGAVEYLALPNSAGTYPAIAGATETLRVVGGAIIQGPSNSPTSVQIGWAASAPAANTNGPIVVGASATATGASGGVLIGYQGSSTNGGVGIGFQVSMTQAGVCIGASSAITGSNNSFATVVGGGSTAALGTAGGGYIVVVGDAASAAHPGAVVVGGTAAASLSSNGSQNTVTIGFNATSSKSSTTVVGGTANSVQTNAICVGAGAAATNGTKTNSVVIGASSSSAGTHTIVVGNLSVSANDQEVIIGGGGTGIAANTMQLGTPSTEITTFVLGHGSTDNTAPLARTIRFTNATVATDSAAGNVTIQAPLSTGAAVPAALVLSGGIVGASGSTVQTAGTIATFRMNATVANIAEWWAGQATFRIVGGSTNGHAFRNSANTRDNLSVNDAGSQLALSDGTQTVQIRTTGATGEISAGALFATTGGGAWLSFVSGSAGLRAGIAYYNGTQYYSAAETTNVAAGFSSLSLMKSGGNVSIGATRGAIATTATEGYLMLPASAGAQTGVPASIPTGLVPVAIDSTNKKIGLYIGGWVWTAALT